MTSAPEGAKSGIVFGAVLGGTLGWLAGIGTLAIPGLGPIIVAGPLLATLAGAGVGGTVGGLAGTLVGFGIPESDAQNYEIMIKEGAMLLSVHVHTNEEIDLVTEIFTDVGGRNISLMPDERFPDADPTVPLNKNKLGKTYEDHLV